MVKCIVECSDSNHTTIGVYNNVSDAEDARARHQRNCNKPVNITLAGSTAKKVVEYELSKRKEERLASEKVYQFVKASDANIFLLESMA